LLFSTRFAFKILSKVFNFDNTEVAANPVHLLYVLEQQIEREQFPPELEQRYHSYIKEHLAQRYVDFIGKEIQTAYLESYSEYGQNIFDRYVTFADFWIQDQEFRDPDTGESFDRESLNAELEKIEKPAGISNPKDFRNEIVNFGLRARATNGGKKGGSRAGSPAAGAGQGQRMRKETDADQIDFNKKILHMSWHPFEDSIAIAATNNLFVFSAL